VESPSLGVGVASTGVEREEESFLEGPIEKGDVEGD
jgi:hypothetical protein